MTAKKENALSIVFDKEQSPILEFAFDAEKQSLTTELEKYENILVTTDTLADDKKLMQELSAKGKAYNRQRIDKVKEISKPIALFEDQMKELTALCDKVAGKIKNQVSVFESARLADLEVRLNDALRGLRDSAKIDDEFRTLSVKQLIKLGSLTAKDALTKGAKDALAVIVAGELSVQQQVNYRLLQLESESHKAKLTIPLVRLNVESFLFEDDDVYANKLAQVISSEVNRQEQAEIKRKDDEVAELEKAEKLEPTVIIKSDSEAVIKHDNQSENLSQGQQILDNAPIDQDLACSTTDEYEQYANSMQQEQESHQPDTSVNDGTIVCTAIACFQIKIPATVTNEQVASKIQSMLDAAGITSLSSLEVLRND